MPLSTESSIGTVRSSLFLSERALGWISGDVADGVVEGGQAGVELLVDLAVKAVVERAISLGQVRLRYSASICEFPPLHSPQVPIFHVLAPNPGFQA